MTSLPKDRRLPRSKRDTQFPRQTVQYTLVGLQALHSLLHDDIIRQNQNGISHSESKWEG